LAVAANAPTEVAAARSPLRAVALPTEHGGWGLTAEPALLGLLVAPSVAGLALGLAALVVFLARTPLRVVLVDRWRGRDLGRTRVARRVLAVELAALAGLVVVAGVTASGTFWWPALLAAPLVALELWFDMRSRSRRLVPELAGSVGVSCVVAMIVLAGGEEPRLAAGLWLVLAGRAISAVPHVRAQVARLHRRASSAAVLAVADLVALVAAAVAVAVWPALLAGALAVAALVGLHRLGARRSVPPAVVIGVRQAVAGLALVAVTAIGVHA
jgi:hypothetical protein